MISYRNKIDLKFLLAHEHMEATRFTLNLKFYFASNI